MLEKTAKACQEKKQSVWKINWRMPKSVTRPSCHIQTKNWSSVSHSLPTFW